MTLDPSVQIHDQALCETDSVGARTRIWAFVHILQGAQVGSDCNLCDYVFIESDVRIGDRVTLKPGVQICDKVEIADDVFIGPNTVFTNDPNPRVAFKKPHAAWLPTRVERGASIGANVTFLCDLTVGAHAFVGAGSVVLGDVPAHGLVVGNPARQIGWVCECGSTLAADLSCHCGRAYQLIDESSGLSPAK